jgi:putative copper resistance protein D
MPDALTAAQMASAVCGDFAFAIALGALAGTACLGGVVKTVRQAPVKLIVQSLGRTRNIALGGLVVVHLLTLWLEAVSMSGAPILEAQAYLVPVITQTHFGASWLIAAIGLAGTIGLDALLRGLPRSAALRERARYWLAFLGLAVYAFGKAGTGHAADAGGLGLPEVVQWVHLGSTGLWAGSVIVSAALVAPRLADTGREPVAPGAPPRSSSATVMAPASPLAGAQTMPAVAGARHVVQHAEADAGAQGTAQADAELAAWSRFAERLSMLASCALVVLLATGIFNALHDLRSALPAALQSTYGRVLAAKLVLVVVAIALGAFNRARYLPRLRRAATASARHAANAALRFQRLLQAEALVLALVLTVAGVLGHTPPG